MLKKLQEVTDTLCEITLEVEKEEESLKPEIPDSIKCFNRLSGSYQLNSEITAGSITIQKRGDCG